MNKYIEREAAYREICADNALSGYEKAYCSELIRNIQAADVATVVHGRWVTGIVHYVCSVCGNGHLGMPQTKYCPDCGAKMDGDGNGG